MAQHQRSNGAHVCWNICGLCRYSPSLYTDQRFLKHSCPWKTNWAQSAHITSAREYASVWGSLNARKTIQNIVGEMNLGLSSPCLTHMMYDIILGPSNAPSRRLRKACTLPSKTTAPSWHASSAMRGKAPCLRLLTVGTAVHDPLLLRARHKLFPRRWPVRFSNSSAPSHRGGSSRNLFSALLCRKEDQGLRRTPAVAAPETVGAGHLLGLLSVLFVREKMQHRW